MKFLVFGDPEGVLQKRRLAVQKTIKKHPADYVIFLGDYFTWTYRYYLKLQQYLKTKNFFDLFPESFTVKEILSQYSYVFVYGNKDMRPEVLRLRKEKERKKLNNFHLVFDKYGESSEFFIINGSNVCPLPPGNRSYIAKLFSKALEEIHMIREKYSGKNRKELIKMIQHILREKYPLIYKLRRYAYCYPLRFASKIVTRKEILLTHTPPYLANQELVFGVYPDEAIFKKSEDGRIGPAYPNEPDATRSNVGSKEILKAVLENNFSLVFSGHIHEGSGIARIKETNTIVINPGSVAAYVNKDKTIPYCYVNLKEREIKIHFKGLFGEKDLSLTL